MFECLCLQIVQCVDVFVSGSHLMLVMELMQSDLQKLIHEVHVRTVNSIDSRCSKPTASLYSAALPLAVQKRVALMFLQGVDEMHNCGILHRVYISCIILTLKTLLFIVSCMLGIYILIYMLCSSHVLTYSTDIRILLWFQCM